MVRNLYFEMHSIIDKSKTMSQFLVVLSILVTQSSFGNGECSDCSVPTLVYDDLKCTPKFSTANECCPTEYDCSHIYNRPKDTCHLKGKFYKVGENPDQEDVAGDCRHPRCECDNNGVFKCIVPSDSCAEFWVPGFINPGCYLAYEHNRCCHSEQKCLFNENDLKCDVGGFIHREGERFWHPDKKCISCICDKGFDGKAEAPFCRQWNCTTELLNSDKIHNYCAPRYFKPDDCCPSSWLCPSESGTYLAAASSHSASGPQCKFGNRLMDIGEKYQHDKTTCECVVPPYLSCQPSVNY